MNIGQKTSLGGPGSFIPLALEQCNRSRVGTFNEVRLSSHT